MHELNISCIGFGNITDYIYYSKTLFHTYTVGSYTEFSPGYCWIFLINPYLVTVYYNGLGCVTISIYFQIIFRIILILFTFLRFLNVCTTTITILNFLVQKYLSLLFRYFYFIYIYLFCSCFSHEYPSIHFLVQVHNVFVELLIIYLLPGI